MINNPIVYVLINGELNMSPGKAAAQAVHAVSMLTGVKEFGENVIRTVIILEAKNTQQILNVAGYLNANNMESRYYIDEGVNEVDAYSITALAVEPIMSDELDKREIFSSFPLFPKKEKKRGFFNRKR